MQQVRIFYNDRKIDKEKPSVYVYVDYPTIIKSVVQREEGKTGASRRGNTSSSSDGLIFGLKHGRA